jgi:hypothetical protein
VVLNQKSESKPITVGPASVLFGHEPLRFSIEGGSLLVVGLKPHHKYLVETDDEEMVETESDRVGTLVLEYPAERKAGVRIHDASSPKEVNSGNGGA